MSTTSMINEQDVRHVATLARLELADDEVTSLVTELGGILEYIKKLEELDTSGVEPTAHAVELSSKLRADQVQSSMPSELGLRGAPEKMSGAFGVPKIIE